MKNLYNQAVKRLRDKGVPHPEKEVRALLAHTLKLKESDLYLLSDKQLKAEQGKSFETLLERREKREPLAYILGFVEFYGCTIELTPSLLIPRQETEQLVDLIVSELQHQDLEGKVLFDVCSGSGCIGIAIKKKFPQLRVVLGDISLQALEVARKNARRNKVAVECVQGDLLEPFKGMKAHFVVCNPPYVTEEEYPFLEPEVRDFEPRLALVGGVQFYIRLKQQLYQPLMKIHHDEFSLEAGIPHFIHKKARLWLEIGASQKDAINEIFENKGEVLLDWSQKSRFFSLEFE